MSQPIDEMFYQVFEDWVWDKHTKVMANKLSELFWSSFSRIWTKYGEILRISLYLVRMRENADQNNFKNGHSSRSVIYTKKYMKSWWAISISIRWRWCSVWLKNLITTVITFAKMKPRTIKKEDTLWTICAHPRSCYRAWWK